MNLPPESADKSGQPVLVVSGSQINRIVVSRMVAATGRGALAVASDEAPELICDRTFSLIVVDDSPAEMEAAELINRIVAAVPGETTRPAIILLSHSTALPAGIEASAIEVIVAKPLTQDRFEAEVFRLAGPSLS